MSRTAPAPGAAAPGAAAPGAARAARATLPGRRRGPAAAVLLGAGVLLVVAVMLSLFVGARPIGPVTTLQALTGTDLGSSGLIVREIRLPRTLLGLAVGAALALAGAILQGITRNPLASPDVLGIGPGAALAVVLAIYLLGVDSPAGYVWFALAGAALAVVVVHVLAGAGGGGATPVRLALSGAVLGAAAVSWTTTIMTLDERTLEEARFWIAGSLSGRSLGVLADVAPFLVLGAVATVLLVRPLDALALGDDAATALGVHPVRSRLIALVAITLLAGGAVAAAGPVAFVGLATPHLARQLVGPEHRVLLPACALFGPALLLLADVTGRLVLLPRELEVGIVTAFLGAPVLIALARRSRLVGA